MFCCGLPSHRTTTQSFCKSFLVSYSTWSKLQHNLVNNNTNPNSSSSPSTTAKIKSQIAFPFPFYGHTTQQSKQRESDLITAAQYYYKKNHLEKKTNDTFENSFQNVLQIVRGPLGTKIEKSNLVLDSSQTNIPFETALQSIEKLIEEYKRTDTIVGYDTYFLTALEYLERYIRPHVSQFLLLKKVRQLILRMYTQLIAQLARGNYFFHPKKETFVFQQFEADVLYAMELFQDVKQILFEEEKKNILLSIHDLDVRQQLMTLFQNNLQDKQLIQKLYLQNNYTSSLHRIVLSIVSAYSHLGLPNFALEFVHSLQQESNGLFFCTLEMYDVILCSYCKLQQVEAAEHLFETIQQEWREEMTEEPFRRMAVLYASLCNSNQVIKIIHSMKQVPSILLFKDVITVLVDSNSDLESIFEMIHYMVQYREELFLFTLKQCSLKKSLLNCYSLIHLAKKMNIPLVPQGYDYLLKMNSDMGNVNDLYLIFDSIKGDGLQPTVQNYNSLIYGLCVNGKSVDALHYFYQLVYETHMKPQSQTIAIAASCFSTPEEAIDFITTFTREPWSISMTISILNSIVKLYCRHGRMKEAILLVTQSQDKFGLHYNVETVSTLIKHLVLQSGDLKSAEEWFQIAFGMRTCDSQGRVIQVMAPADSRNVLHPQLEIFVILYTGYALEVALDNMTNIDMRRSAYCVPHTMESKRYFKIVKQCIEDYLQKRYQMGLSIPLHNDSFVPTNQLPHRMVQYSQEILSSEDEYYRKLFEQIQTELNG